MSDLTGMFSALNESINANPLAAKGPGTPEGMPYNPMDNINPLMASVAQGVGNVVGTDPALNQTSGQKMTESNAAGASAMQTGDPAGLMAAAQLMFKQGRPKEAQALVERADAIKAQRSSADLLLTEERERLEANERAADVAKEAGHLEWEKRLRTGDLDAQKYYEAMAENEAELLKQNAIGANKVIEEKPMSAGMLKITEDSFTKAVVARGVADTGQHSLRLIDNVIKGGKYRAGILGGWIGNVKEALGAQNEVTAVLQRYDEARLKTALANLPPGPASEKDIELVQKPAPKPNASIKSIREYIAAVTRIERRKAIYYEMKGEWYETNRSGAGLYEAYQEELASRGLSAMYEGGPQGGAGRATPTVDGANLPTTAMPDAATRALHYQKYLPEATD